MNWIDKINFVRLGLIWVSCQGWAVQRRGLPQLKIQGLDFSRIAQAFRIVV